MYHIPLGVISAGNPMVLVDSFIVFYPYKVVCSCKLPVEISCRNNNFFVFGKTTRGLPYYCECLRQDFFQLRVVSFQYFFLQLVDLIEDYLPVFNGCFFYLFLQFFDFFFQVIGRVLHLCAKFLCLSAQCVIVKGLYGRFFSFDFFNPRLYFPHVAG